MWRAYSTIIIYLTTHHISWASVKIVTNEKKNVKKKKKLKCPGTLTIAIAQLFIVKQIIVQKKRQNIHWTLHELLRAQLTSMLLSFSVPLSTPLYVYLQQQQSGHFSLRSLTLNHPTCLLTEAHIEAARQEDDDHTICEYVSTCKSISIFSEPHIPVYLLLILCHSTLNRERKRRIAVLLLRQPRNIYAILHKNTINAHPMRCCWPVRARTQYIRDLSGTINLMAFVQDCFSIIYARKIGIGSMAKNKMNLHGICVQDLFRSEEEIAWEWDILNFSNWNGKTHMFFYVQMHFEEIFDWRIETSKREKDGECVCVCVWYVVCSHLKYFNMNFVVCIICDASRLRLD